MFNDPWYQQPLWSGILGGVLTVVILAAGAALSNFFFAGSVVRLLGGTTPATLAEDLDRLKADQNARSVITDMVAGASLPDEKDVQDATKKILAGLDPQSSFVRAVAAAVNVRPVEHPRIRIVDVVWGGSTEYFVSYRTPERNPEARAIIKQACDGKETCELLVDNEKLRPNWLTYWNSLDDHHLRGEPSAHVNASIYITYACGEAAPTTLTANYNDFAYLSCKPAPPPGRLIVGGG
jgi:hypothetical protein